MKERVRESLWVSPSLNSRPFIFLPEVEECSSKCSKCSSASRAPSLKRPLRQPSTNSATPSRPSSNSNRAFCCPLPCSLADSLALACVIMATIHTPCWPYLFGLYNAFYLHYPCYSAPQSLALDFPINVQNVFDLLNLSCIGSKSHCNSAE